MVSVKTVKGKPVQSLPIDLAVGATASLQ